MPIIRSAKKAHEASLRKGVFNLRRSRTMKEAIKEVKDLARSGDAAGADKKLPEAYKAIDKAAKRGVVKKNTASRKKSQLTREIARAGEKKSTSTKTKTKKAEKK